MFYLISIKREVELECFSFYLVFYFPRQTLSGLYKLYVRLHLDKGDCHLSHSAEGDEFRHEITVHHRVGFSLKSDSCIKFERGQLFAKLSHTHYINKH